MRKKNRRVRLGLQTGAEGRPLWRQPYSVQNSNNQDQACPSAMERLPNLTKALSLALENNIETKHLMNGGTGPSVLHRWLPWLSAACIARRGTVSDGQRIGRVSLEGVAEELHLEGIAMGVASKGCRDRWNPWRHPRQGITVCRIETWGTSGKC